MKTRFVPSLCLFAVLLLMWSFISIPVQAARQCVDGNGCNSFVVSSPARVVAADTGNAGLADFLQGPSTRPCGLSVLAMVAPLGAAFVLSRKKKHAP